MKICLTTAVAAVLLLPAALTAQEPIDGRASAVDEVRVIGRSVTTDMARVEVSRELLVDTATVLKDIPGSNVNANGPVTGIAQYRGMFGDRISVVIDHLGVVSGGPNAMDTPLSYLSPMITENLSVVRGIPSVSLAPESIGGHVSTTLSRGDFSLAGPALSGFVGSRYSANGNVSTSASRLTLASNTHKLSFIAEVDDGASVSTPVGESRPSQLHRERSDLSYAFAGDSTSVLLFAGRLDTDDTGTPALPMDIRFIDTKLAGAQATLELNEIASLEARVAWNDVEHLMDNFGLRQAPMPPMQRQNFTTGSGTRASLATTITLSGSTLILGIDTSTADHDATITNPNNAMFRVDNFVDVSRDVLSAFAEWKRDAGRGDIEVGMRARRVETDSGEVFAAGMMGDMGTNVAALADAFNMADRSKSWSSVDAVLKYRWQIESGAEWRVELGSKTRAPSYQELYLWLPLQATGGLADGRSYIGGLDLDEERSNEITIGFGRDIGRFTISPQVFFKRIDAYIQGVPSTDMTANMVSQMMSGNPALQFSNVDAEIYGADIAWQLELSDQWSLDGVASWTRGKRRDINDNLYRLAPPNASIGLLWENDRLAIASELVAYAAQDDVSVFNAEQRTPGYALINATLTWTPADALRIETRLDNLFDTTYQDHVAGINRANGSDIPVGVRLYGAERTLSAGIIWSF